MEPQVEARQSKVTARWTFLSLHLYLRFKGLISPPSEPHGEIMSFGVSPSNYSDSDLKLSTLINHFIKKMQIGVGTS